MKDGIAVPGGKDIDNLDAAFAATLYPGPVSPSAVWPNGKVYLFKGDSPAVAEQFAQRDSYVRRKLVRSWKVRPWMTIVGDAG